MGTKCVYMQQMGNVCTLKLILLQIICFTNWNKATDSSVCDCSNVWKAQGTTITVTTTVLWPVVGWAGTRRKAQNYVTKNSNCQESNITYSHHSSSIVINACFMLRSTLNCQNAWQPVLGQSNNTISHTACISSRSF